MPICYDTVNMIKTWIFLIVALLLHLYKQKKSVKVAILCIVPRGSHFGSIKEN